MAGRYDISLKKAMAGSATRLVHIAGYTTTFVLLLCLLDGARSCSLVPIRMSDVPMGDRSLEEKE